LFFESRLRDGRVVVRQFAEFEAEEFEVGAGDAQPGEEERGAAEVDGIHLERLDDLVGRDLYGGGVFDRREGKVGLVGVLGGVEQAVGSAATGGGVAGASGEADVLTARGIVELRNRHWVITFQFFRRPNGINKMCLGNPGVLRGRISRNVYKLINRLVI
jgi:hypothetical protein